MQRVLRPELPYCPVQLQCFSNIFSILNIMLIGKFPSRLGYEYTPIGRIGGKILGRCGTKYHPGIYHQENEHNVRLEDMHLPLDTLTIPKALKHAYNNTYETIQIGTSKAKQLHNTTVILCRQVALGNEA